MRQHGLISTDQAARLGFPAHRLSRSPAWDMVVPRVYHLAASPETWQSELMAAVLAGGTGAVASHRSAVLLHHLDGVVKENVEISVPRPRQLPKRAWMIVHRVGQLERIDTTWIEHIPVTSVTRTLIDLGAVCDVDTVELALESALRRRITSLALIHQRLAVIGGRGSPGTAALRCVLNRRANDAPTGSHLETQFVQLCRRHGIPPGTRQYQVGAFRVDWAWEDRHVMVELEGFGYHGSPGDHRHDMTRQNAVMLALPGWVLLRFGWVDVSERAQMVVDELRAALAISCGARDATLVTTRAAPSLAPSPAG